MNILRKTLLIITKTVASVVMMALIAVLATSVSFVYTFSPAAPFAGPDIYNPYRNLDTANCWKRANFHTHTRVDGLLNECEYWPAEVHEAYDAFGYDIVTFSNHNRLTAHPFDPALQVNVYEHGYNLSKYHKLVFGSGKVNRFDNLLPLFAFQKQFQIDLLSKDSDIIQINHPLRTDGTSKDLMEKLDGYRLIELDSGKSTENEYWDWALSAGRYSFGTANDDLHYPDRSSRIAIRSNFLCTTSASYEDLKKTLLEGCWYSMRTPDYGKGDWEVKHKENLDLPGVAEIGLNGERIYITLTERADSIKITGQGHSTLKLEKEVYGLDYIMKPEDSYARITAYFQDGEVIYTNPFARYDASVSSDPFTGPTHAVNIFLTVLYNLLVIALTAGTAALLIKMLRK